ncbi:DUF1616 domain-containing protein [Halostagnicola sp. A-GB9-2]|uniref:DUF1616 domain-containing protein n=1 Tax=Halostagnicola sp. A-GB9-2 TaxID=3048066 RepID=UPI0024C0C838|nr:DUF1616 domain-containing protein [Halostagnicola sp. A-GB9-2]MDJ1434545.1 DUF1616 domain-containing protein [Halostagnicola sp. A-GB9-2]
MKDRLTRVFQPFVTADRKPNRILRRAPTDLVAVSAFVVVAGALLAILDIASPLVRAAVGFPLLFLAPGYATVSALFPRASPSQRGEATLLVEHTRPITEAERAALAFGLSFGLLPLLGLGIGLTPFGFTTSAVVGAVSIYTLVGVWIAAARRHRIASAERYRFDFGRKLAAGRRAVFDTGSAIHTAVNVLLVVSMLLALTTVGYALVSPQQGAEYTDLRLLTEDGSDEFVASNYSTSVESGEAIPFTVATENQEGEEMEYTVVVQEQWISDGEILERTELERSDYNLDDGSIEYSEQNVTPEAESGAIRISVMLYDGDVPDTPTHDNAYRYTYFTTEVTDETAAE